VPGKLRVFVDADVLFAGAASPSTYGASYIVLRMGELTLLDCLTCQQVILEVERNLAEKLSHKLPELRLLISRCLRVVPDPTPGELKAYHQQADPKDLVILAAARREQCSHLLTFNVSDFHPPEGQIIVRRPGDFLLTVRSYLSALAWQRASEAN